MSLLCWCSLDNIDTEYVRGGGWSHTGQILYHEETGEFVNGDGEGGEVVVTVV